MISSRNQIIAFIEQGKIPAENIKKALEVVKVAPDAKSWRRFIDHLMLWLGGLALAFSALFFIAYNWNNLGRFVKFGMVEVFIVLAIAAHIKFADRAAAGKVFLVLATIFLGVLLALYGQTYQTGADPWQLFCNWALMIIPWVLVGRFPVLWVIWIVLINLSIVLYHQASRGGFGFMFGPDTQMLWVVFFFNTVVLIAWEVLSRSWDWLAERWAICLIGAAGSLPATLLALHGILDRGGSALYLIPWMIWLAAIYYYYRRVRPELFMLAVGCLSGLVVVVAFLAKHMLQDWAWAGFLFLAMVVIGLGLGAAIWLRNVHREWQS